MLALGLATVMAVGCSRDAATTATGPAVDESGPVLVDITGSDFNWIVRYAGADGRFATEDDVLTKRHVHLPEGRSAEFRLHSEDYLYTLAFPDFGLKEIAVPDMEFSLTLHAERAGTYQLKGDQFCGFSHPDLIGELVVESPEEFERWLAEQRDR